MTDQMEGIASYGREMGRLAAQSRDIRRFTKLARKLQVMADGEIERLQSEAASLGIHVACKKGCANCCKRLVVATVPEVITAVEMLWEKPIEEREAFLARADASTSQNAEFWDYREVAATAPCAFLVNNECSIYDIRPLTCRSMNSDDPQKCLPSEFETNDQPPAVVPHQNEISNIAAQLVAVCREAGVVSGGYEFGTTVAAVLRNPALLAGLEPMNPELDKLKLFSEFSVMDATLHPDLAAELKDPSRRKILELLQEGKREEGIALLPTQDSVTFATIYRHAMPPHYRSMEDLESWWQRWGTALEDFENARLNSKEVFDYIQPFNTFSLAYSGRDVKPYLERFMGVAHRHAQRALPYLTAPITAPRRPGKFRLGYVSYRIKNFNGSRWAIGWLKNHSPDIETFVINLTEQEDATSLVFRRNADNYFHVPLPVAHVAAFIRELDLDALIFTDVGMCGHTTQLSLLRMARRQLGAWGHPVTSGSPMMDEYLSSELMEPENGELHYTEKLVRLPGSGLCYMRRQITQSHKSASELGLPESGFLFCGQNPMKITPDHDALFLEIAGKSKKPLVFLADEDHPEVDYLKERLGKPGLNVLFVSKMSRPDYLRALELADVSLDPPGWNGGNTTIEALTLGTPVVSMAGQFMRGRHGLAFLKQANVEGLLANCEDDYIDLALNEDRRNEVFKSVQIDGMYEDKEPVRTIDRLLLGH